MTQYYRAKHLHQPAGRLPVSRSTFYAWIKEGRFPKGRLISPGVRMWSAAEVDAAIEAMALQQQGAADA